MTQAEKENLVQDLRSIGLTVFEAPERICVYASSLNYGPCLLVVGWMKEWHCVLESYEDGSPSFYFGESLKEALKRALTSRWAKHTLGIRGAVLWERIKDKL